MTTKFGHPPETGRRGRPSGPKRALLVVDPSPAWTEIVEALRADDIESEITPLPATPDQIMRRLQRGGTVLVVDLSADAVRGMTLVTACRRAVHRAPVVVVATNPSVELARRIRLSGVFYLALQPVSVEEMRTALHDAYDCMVRERPDTSMCHARRRVLIVDDDRDFVASTRALLEAQGYSVTSSANGGEALASVKADPPDLIVLDLMAEDDSGGYAVNQAIKFGQGFECLRHIPIVMVSVDPSRRCHGGTGADATGPDVFLAKPLEIGRFLEAIKELLGEPDDVVAT